jgi:plasmid stabilization system protein ParE
MKVEWSDEALADLDRFVEFLNREHPSLAATVAGEIISKTRVLAEHPRLGRPIAGREEYRQIVLRVVRAASMFFGIASMASGLSCSGCFMHVRRASDRSPP